jgi:hypothetical protein
MVVNALVTDPINTGITFGIIPAGVPAYLAWRTWRPPLLEPIGKKELAAEYKR